MVAAAIVVVLIALLAAGGAVFLTRQAAGPSTEDLVDAAGPSTVLITADVGGSVTGTATGWVLDAADGLIVTNHHVVNAGTGFTVGRAGERKPAQLVATAPCEDLALLRVSDTRGLVSLPLGSQADLRQGEEVLALGYPANVSNTSELVATRGIVSVVKSRFDVQTLDTPAYSNVIQTDSVLNPGSSGGPLIDRKGRLVGVNTARIHSLGGPAIEGESYAIGVDQVRDVVAQLRAGTSIGWTGFLLQFPQKAQDFADYGLPSVPGGIIVPHAVALSPAITAGFGSEAAVITSANGFPFDGTLMSYCRAVGTLRSGATATFHVVLATTEGDLPVGFA